MEKKFLLISLALTILFTLVQTREISEDEITFRVFPGSGRPQFNSTFNESLADGGCDPKGNFALIVHGWIEGWHTEWVKDLVSNLTEFRGGCIMLMDYSNFSVNPNYFELVTYFDQLSGLLHQFMDKLDDEGFDFNRGYMFGFSFGAHLAINTAIDFGPKKWKEIDVCEPAGPGFENRQVSDVSEAAQNVQCIHTSNSYGTSRRNCTQNWNMGICGHAQLGAMPFPKGSHGLCPYFYVAAFKHDFLAYKNIYGCSEKRAADSYPERFKMGYMEQRKNKVSGDLFSPTSVNWPFNEIPVRHLKTAELERLLQEQTFEISLTDASSYIATIKH